MDIKRFLNTVVVSAENGKKYYLAEITSPYLKTIDFELNENGNRAQYIWPTINGNPIENGCLFFEDESLTEPFKAAYDAYCHSRDAYWEEYGYWLRRD